MKEYMNNKKIILHGNDPWDLPGNTKTEALRTAILYCISRSIPYKVLSEYLNVTLAKIQQELFYLRKNGNIEFIDGLYQVNRWGLQHITNKRFAKIYDAVIPHIKSEYFRIDDIGIYGESSYAVRYMVNHKRFMWDEHGNRTWVNEEKRKGWYGGFNWFESCAWSRISPIDINDFLNDDVNEIVVEKIRTYCTHMHENYYRRDHPVIVKKDPILSYSI